MKGTPQFPMCGFSSRTVQALGGRAQASVPRINVLEGTGSARQPAALLNWLTFPQLFINGELIGGCDITMELYESANSRG